MVIYSKQNPPIGFYVYAYLSDDGIPYYIGKGQNARAWNKNHNVDIPKNNLIIILECNLTEIGALALERRYIKWYGRKDINTGVLLNKTAGGESFCGEKSENWKHQQSVRFTGDKNPMKLEENRNKIKGKNHGMYGKTHTDEVKVGMKQRMTGAGNPMYGKKRPEVGLRAKEYAKVKVKCPHCEVTGSRGIMKRWHFNNCKNA